MKKILVPTDFSDSARNAEEYAVLLAKQLNAQVQLLHVYREVLPATIGPEPWSVTVTDTYIENQKLLNKEIEYLQQKLAANITGLIKIGGTGNGISSVAKEVNADLIVMGISKSKNKLGSTVIKAIRKTTLPVLVVPAAASFMPYKNMVLAIDFNQMIDSTSLEPLYNLYKQFSPAMRVLHVDKKGADLKSAEVPVKLQTGHLLAKFDYLYDRIEYDNIEEGIEKFIEDHPADLLVMIAHHHNLFERLFVTPHTSAISFEVKRPLLILKSQ